MSASVFISYASQDHTSARTICDAIEARGLSCWISSRDIGPGENSQVAIVRAIRNAKAMVMVFSGHAGNSEEIRKELALAGQSRLAVVPVRIEDVTADDAFADELGTCQWVDAFDDWEPSMQRLVQQLSSAAEIVPVAVSATMVAEAEPATEAAPAPIASVLVSPALVAPGLGTPAPGMSPPGTPNAPLAAAVAPSIRWGRRGLIGVTAIMLAAGAWVWLGHSISPPVAQPKIVATAPSPPPIPATVPSPPKAPSAPEPKLVAPPNFAMSTTAAPSEPRLVAPPPPTAAIAPPLPASSLPPPLPSPMAEPPMPTSPSPVPPEPPAAPPSATPTVAAPIPNEPLSDFTVAGPGATEAKAIAPQAVEQAHEALKRKNYPELTRIAREAAASGNPIGQRILGYVYLRGLGVTRDYAQSLHWFKVAGDQGDGIAQNDIGLFHLNGWGVAKDYAEAMRWFRRAADQGQTFGDVNVGRMYEHGWGVTKDYAEAMRWFRQAADKGNPAAGFQLGLVYANGRGVARDLDQARTWMQRAASGGNAAARRWLAEHQ